MFLFAYVVNLIIEPDLDFSYQASNRCVGIN
jgi:hypothetical protein